MWTYTKAIEALYIEQKSFFKRGNSLRMDYSDARLEGLALLLCYQFLEWREHRKDNDRPAEDQALHFCREWNQHANQRFYDDEHKVFTTLVEHLAADDVLHLPAVIDQLSE